jgi:hypothetical protein
MRNIEIGGSLVIPDKVQIGIAIDNAKASAFIRF